MGHSLIAIGGLLYLFGGYLAGGTSTSAELFVLNTTDQAPVWRNLTANCSGSVPSARALHGAAVLNNNKLLICMGRSITEPGTSTIYSLDFRTMNWTLESSRISNTMKLRYGGGVAVVQDRLYLFGGAWSTGYATAGILGTLEVLNLKYYVVTDMLKVRGEVPRERYAHGMATVRGTIYIFSGFNDPTEGGFYSFSPSLCLFFSVGTGGKIRSNSPPAARALSSMVGEGDSVYVFGGVQLIFGFLPDYGRQYNVLTSIDHTVKYLNDLWRFNTTINQWSQIQALNPPTPRHVHGLAALKGYLFVFGGSAVSGSADYVFAQPVPVNDFHIYDINGSAWTKVAPSPTAPSPRVEFGFVAIDQRLYLFGGAYQYRGIFGDFYGDFYSFDPSAMEWTNLTNELIGPRIPARCGHGFVASSGSLFIFDGSGEIGTYGGGFLRDLYRIDVATLVVTEISSLVQGSAPSARTRFGSVLCNGIIYIFGGMDDISARSDLRGFAVQRTLSLPAYSPVSFFMRIYDWDILKAEKGTIVLPQHLNLCSGSLPCSMQMIGSAGNVLHLEGQGSISCRSTIGCTALTLESLHVACASSAMLSVFDVQGSHLRVSNSSFDSCSSNGDGGTMKTYHAAVVVIADSVFRNSFSSALGGAVSLVGVQASLSRVQFINCTSLKGGGAISMSGFTLYGSPQPFGTVAEIEFCTFQDCTSEDSGGAVFASTSVASVFIIDSIFITCVAANTGGAIAAIDLVNIAVSHSLFQRNDAGGDGGGALYFGNAPSLLQNITFQGNSARFGGGGAILWGGEFEPQIEYHETAADFGNFSSAAMGIPAHLCSEDLAAYGPCMASTYKILSSEIMMTGNSHVYPGLSFSVKVLKTDNYHQTIVTDSTSVVQMFASSTGSDNLENSAVSILGSTVNIFSRGQASFIIAIKPNFLQVIPCNDSSLLYSPPFIHIQGVDVSTKLNMRSRDIIIPLSKCNGICPQGHVLQLEHPGTNGKPGSCILCSSGTYSFSPLTGSPTNPDTPSCLKCPAGADCSAGGDQVSFALGSWARINGRYILMSCPAGHQLVNSSTGTSYGLFSHDDQQCKPCKQNQYIVDQLQSCQTCPNGATCDGSKGQLTGLPGSYWRREGDKMRIYSCKPGYILVRDDAQNGAKSFLDTCVPCLPSTYSMLGAKVINLEQCTWTGDPGQPYTCIALTESNVIAFDHAYMNGSWTSNPSSAQQLCIKCPVGANCPGGSNIIPERGFWMENPHNASVQQLGSMDSTSSDWEVAILKCIPDACGENGTCNQGRKGPVCAVCDEGWAMASNVCQQCPTDAKAYEAERILIAIAGSIVAVILYYYFSLRSLFIKDDQEVSSNETVEDQAGEEEDLGISLNIEAQSILDAQGIFRAIKARIGGLFRNSEVLLFLQGYCKVIISFFQVLSTFANNLRIGWPLELTDLFQKSSFLRLDLLALPGLNCLSKEVNFQTKLLIYTVSPLIVIGLLCIPVCISEFFSKLKSKKEAVRSQFWYALMLFLFFIYPTLSLATLRSFNCQTIGRYGSLLLADYNEPCPYQGGSIFSTNNFVFWWSLAFTIVYPLGIPIFFLLVMVYFKIPFLADLKIQKAKIEALITSYMRRAMPLEVEILTRQLKVGKISPCGDLIKMQTCLLFEAVARGKADVSVHDIVEFIKQPSLGLPDPDEVVIQKLFEARDSSKDGKLDRDEFLEMMSQAIFAHDLFTGHEALEDMHFEQLHRLYEFHANDMIYLEYDMPNNECTENDTNENKTVHALKSSMQNTKDSMLKYFEFSGTKRIVTADMFLESSADVDKTRLLESDLEHSLLLDETSEIEYPGLDKLRRLEKTVSEYVFSRLQEMMVPDLRRKVHALADAKLASGGIVLNSLAWDMTEYKNSATTATATDEQVAVKRLGFLMKNYDVQHWYFEILEMIRKLLMTSIIAFIYPGTSAQLVAALLISILSAVHVQATRPFLDNTIGSTQTYALMAHSLTLVYGIMLLFQEIYSDMLHLPQPFSQEAVTKASAILVVLMNLCTVAWPYLSMLLTLGMGCCLRFAGKKANLWGCTSCSGRRTEANQHTGVSPDGASGSPRVGSVPVRDARLWSRSCLSEAAGGEFQPLMGSAIVGNETADEPQPETALSEGAGYPDNVQTEPIAGAGVGLGAPQSSTILRMVGPARISSQLSFGFHPLPEEPGVLWDSLGPFYTEQLRRDAALPARSWSTEMFQVDVGSGLGEGNVAPTARTMNTLLPVHPGTETSSAVIPGWAGCCHGVGDYRAAPLTLAA